MLNCENKDIDMVRKYVDKILTYKRQKFKEYLTTGWIMITWWKWLNMEIFIIESHGWSGLAFGWYYNDLINNCDI